MVKIGTPNKFDPMDTMDIYAAPGTKVRFMNCNGYPSERVKAAEELDTSTIYTVNRIEVGGSSSRVYFEHNPGRGYNTVMFTEV